MSSTTCDAPGAARPRIFGFVALAVAELLLVSFTYKLGFDFDCHAEASRELCRAGRDILPALFMLLGGLVLLALARPAERRALLAAEPADARKAWIIHAAGLLIVLAPRIWLMPGAGTAGVATAGIAAAIGAVLALMGGGLAFALAGAWLQAIRRNLLALLLVALTAVLLPSFARDIAGAAWRFAPITEATFATVAALLDLLGYAPLADAKTKSLAIGDFAIRIGKPCSGMQGLALVTLFLSAFFILFRKTLRFPVALLLLPIGLIASLLLNVVRITVLVILGVEISPELAVGGFHSHAGWLLFTALSLGLALLGRAAFGRKTASRERMALIADPIAAATLPFAIFMLTALLASTFLTEPEIAYPARIAAVGLTLMAFAPVYWRMPWRHDFVAVLSGSAVGVAWIATAPAAEGSLAVALEALPPLTLAAWVACRIVGTVFLVPLVEELFFRGYVMMRVSRVLGPLAGIVGSAVAFGLLHDRWIIAVGAGLVFGFVARRRGLPSAILSHLAANAVVAMAAAATHQWHLI